MTATGKLILPFGERLIDFGIALIVVTALLSRSNSDSHRINRRLLITMATGKRTLQYFDLRAAFGICCVRRKDFWRCSLVWEMTFPYRIPLFGNRSVWE